MRISAFSAMSALATALFAFTSAHAQVVSFDPPLPDPDVPCVLHYNAAEGNAALLGQIPVYIHTGVITSASSGPSDWQHVVTPWASTDADWAMDFEANNQWSYDFNGLSLNDFFSIPDGEIIEQLAMVFRNGSGSLVGRAEDGSDLFLNVSDGSFSAVISSPQAESVLMVAGESTTMMGVASQAAHLTWTLGTDTLAQALDAISLPLNFSPENPGNFSLVFTANNGSAMPSDQIAIQTLPGASPMSSPPAGTLDGLTIQADGSVILQLFAPGKSHVLLVGDMTNWALEADYLMQHDEASDRFWIQLDGLNATTPYRYQFHVMPDNARYADPYATLQLDFWNDPWIPNSTYPFLQGYPEAAGNHEPVSVFTIEEPEFDWTDDDFQRPEQENLVVYELLVRDFTEERTFAAIEDTLDYLQGLNISAIELMPVNEFNGNISWGYNPSFYFAVDKYYGPKEALQSLIDAAHARGIAVIVDLVMNHCDWPNPQITMWWEDGAPSEDNPFFNVEAPHNFAFFFDYNHESEHTRAFTKRVMDYWRETLHVDGFRWDLSSGFTQTSQNSSYDASRIAIWTDYGQHVWAQDEDFYMILEHWTENAEEKELSEQGFMFWANITHDFQEAAMGYPSNMNWASYQARGWDNPLSVSYMESHDEERMLFKNLAFGNSGTDSQGATHDAGILETALNRAEGLAVLHQLLPGPKMLWQFEELGYDYSINTCGDGVTINEDCRVDPKPVRWDYRDVSARYRLYQVFAAVNALKRDLPTFQTDEFNWDVWGSGKRLILEHASMDAVAAFNAGVAPLDMVPGFTHTGSWYDYFTGETVDVTDLEAAVPFEPGAYRLWTDQPLETPEIIQAIANFPGGPSDAAFLNLYPNPSEAHQPTSLRFANPLTSAGELAFYDITGACKLRVKVASGEVELALPQELSPGVYALNLNMYSGESHSTIWIHNER
jgi:hypothetical protein